jgi:hypothetical protein
VKRKKRMCRLSACLLVLPLLLFSSPILADVYVYDAVALQGEEVRLKAETRGTVFIKGGELVEFFVDDA